MSHADIESEAFRRSERAAHDRVALSYHFSVLPVAFYLIMQRRIVAGLTAGAVKG